ncbi:MAG: YjiH family protein, partial [Pygmaiobacter sp.]
MFFVTVPFRGNSTIPLDVLCTVVCDLVGNAQQWVVLAVCVAGALLPFVKKTWNQNKTSIVFTVLKIVGVLCAVMFISQTGPQVWLENVQLLPFLFGLGRSLSFLVPLGAIFLAFLTNYGLMEFVGAFVHPFMRKIWNTPGSSAIDAVVSFVGSYSVALLITDGLYQKGVYTKKEAVIIATGFSTVSSTFMVTVASTLKLMDRWNLYFWSTLVITFAVTAFTVRMFPLNRFPDEYCEGVEPKPEKEITQDRFQTAISTALNTAENSGKLTANVWNAFLGGLQMTCTIVPSILSVGLIGMLLALYTPIFDLIGFIFYPFTALMQVPEAL